jgi:hypothetical protein
MSLLILQIPQIPQIFLIPLILPKKQGRMSQRERAKMQRETLKRRQGKLCQRTQENQEEELIV